MELKQLLAIQLQEINEHKYFLSLQHGYDVGLPYAFQDWAETHAPRFRETAEQHAETIDSICSQYCGKTCLGPKHCPLPVSKVHEILEDGY